MTLTDNTRTAVIVASHGSLFERLAESAGFRVIGVATTSVLGEKLVSLTRPDVIVVESELPGEQGIDALEHLRHASPGSEVVLIVEDELVKVDSGRISAYAVLSMSHLGDLKSLLGTLDSRIGDRRHEPRSRTERRSGDDRRQEQDWSKVGWDKRAHNDRRLATARPE